MSKVKIILVCSLVMLAFVGGSIYQYYCQDKCVLEEQQVRINILNDYCNLWEMRYYALKTKYDDIFDYSYTKMPIDLLTACFWLDRAAYSHEHNLFDDDPDNDEFHQGCIDRYASIKNLLLELTER